VSFDHTTYADAFSRPGIDPRQWVSYGTVDEDTPEARSVRFLDDDGAPLPTGPLVTVTLHPSGISVVCRVASFIAGVGEGTWFPIMPRDEVIVILPGGSERSGPVIVGRLNQALDAWPGVVAGQDATKNVFGFWRLRTPFIVESVESFLIRSAKTGSQIGITSDGGVVLNNGDKNNLFITSDVISLSSGDENTFIQLNFTENRITAATGQARFELSAKGKSILQAPGDLNIGSGGAAGKGHAVTVEQLLLWTANLVCGLGVTGAFGPGPYATPAWTGGAAVGLLNALFAAMIPVMATPTPVGVAGAPGGNTAPIAAAYQALNLALANPLPAIDPTGLIPGPGRGTLMF